MSKKEERNYWPHSIIGIILSVVIAGAYTVKIAMDNPVQEDTYFMQKYQSVDKNINKLIKEKTKFDNTYKVVYSTKKFTKGKNNFYVEIHNKKTAKLVKNADVTLLITKPETNEYNQKVRPNNIENGRYFFTDIKIEKIGRWKVLSSIKAGEFSGFNTLEMYVSE